MQKCRFLVREKQEGNELVIWGEITDSDRVPHLLKTPEVSESSTKPCPVCRTNLDIKHTDVLILSQFLRSDGCMLPRRITGLCKKQQKRIGTMVAMAQKAGLMINITPNYCKKDPKKRYQWKKFNTYFLEDTIKC